MDIVSAIIHSLNSLIWREKVHAVLPAVLSSVKQFKAVLSSVKQFKAVSSSSFVTQNDLKTYYCAFLYQLTVAHNIFVRHL